MRIAAIRASVHAFPVRLPFIDTPQKPRTLVVATVETDEGMTGHGITGAFLPTAVKAALENEFLPVIRGMNPEATEAIHTALGEALNSRAATGTFSHALSALDIALWDIRGQAAGRSVAALLGGARTACEAYATFGFPSYSEDQLAQAAEAQLAEGFRALKMVVGVAPGGWREDLARIRRVRRAIGPSVALMIDANCRFSPYEARCLANAAAEHDIAWFEEPLVANDAPALADLRRTTPVPVAAGQMEGHRFRLRELVTHQAVDVLQPNVAYAGGFTEVQKVGHLAQAFAMPLDNGGGWPLHNLHAMAGLANGGMVEFHLDMRQIGETLFEGAPRPANGHVSLPEGHGLGLIPRARVLEETRIA
ncbi:MAG: mandelate racemase/muconate lactonizing enzyme family protein [Acetobacteraceae bacterium]|jgi:L-alanine-DL-glutamate epimerase-like enolase superfamily enzyme|nr:mandelate racemase/muconate lactonizing enzyme family protein [Acetobacteraceae bacterium]